MQNWVLLILILNAGKTLDSPQNNCIYPYYVLFHDSAKWVLAIRVSAKWSWIFPVQRSLFILYNE